MAITIIQEPLNYTPPTYFYDDALQLLEGQFNDFLNNLFQENLE